MLDALLTRPPSTKMAKKEILAKMNTLLRTITDIALIAILVGFMGVRVVSAEVEFLFKFGCPPPDEQEFNFPNSVAIDSTDRIIVADTLIHQIQVFDSVGNFLLKFGSFGTGDGQFNIPDNIDVDTPMWSLIFHRASQ